MNVRLNLLVGALAAWLFAVDSAAARIEPSFHLEQASWDATHVILVAGDRIAESWKGDLTPDDKPPAPLLHAERGVLFLVKKRNEAGVVTWESAAGVGEGKQRTAFALSVSQVGFKDGKTVAIQQWKNPGPAELLPLSDDAGREFDEASFKDEVLRLTALQLELQTTLKIEDPAQRAKALRRLMQSQCWYTWHEGFAALRACGVAAAPQWSELLADDTLLVRHPEILREIARFNTPETSAAVIELLNQELEFWKKHAGDLPVTWRTGKGVPPHLFQEVNQHHQRLMGALTILAGRPAPAAAKPVRALRDFWRSLRQLDDNNGPRDISKLCDRVLSNAKMPDKFKD